MYCIQLRHAEESLPGYPPAFERYRPVIWQGANCSQQPDWHLFGNNGLSNEIAM